MHTADVEPDATSAYLPALQAVQAEVPLVRELYAPARQAVHADVPVVNAL